MNETRPAPIPPAALYLGCAGLIPFIAGAAGLWLFTSEARLEGTLTLFLGYSAVILSFMGAVHWGLAMAEPRYAPARAMSLSVMPALLAWLALALPPPAAAVVFALGFGGVYMIDEAARRRGHAPAWYRRLRLPLTAVVIACELVVLAATSMP